MRKHTTNLSPSQYQQLDLFSAERWQSIPGYDARYEASDQGRIRARTSGKGQHPKPIILKPYTTAAGYVSVKMRRDNKMHSMGVHQLIALAFIGPRPDGMEVNHIDGDKKNNRADNLQYLTHLDNIRHAWQTGLHGGPKPKMNADQVTEIRKLLRAGISGVQVAKVFGINQMTVSKIRNGVGCYANQQTSS